MNPSDPIALTSAAPEVPAPTVPTVDPLAEPTFEECIVEWNRYHEDVSAGRLNGIDIPGGHYFAYYGGKIIDHDPDYIALQERAAAKAGVHWARLVIRYAGEPFLILS